MKISLNWLKRYINLNQSVERIGEILTDIGLEVEGIDKVESVKGGLKGIVIGQVKKCIKHPDADKLSLTKVDIGESDLLQIVCGAPNVGEGQKVLVATIGTTLYTPEGESWKIKKGKIRGESSEGMICAEDELGLGNDHNGIMVLPEDAVIGTAASEYFELEDDYIFDIGLTPNRSDATSHYGVAEDIAAYLKINSDDSIILKDFIGEEFEVDNKNINIEVTVEDKDACPRYSALTFSNIEVKESPEWIKNLLKSIDVRPINNIVDITNFILHAYGQALHVFDADKISKNEVRVKCLPEGTPFLSLDGKERKLNAEDLMICDGEDNPMCIAGVFGGLNSGVTDSTTNIFLESAHFNSSSIRKTSTKHLLRTDAAKIFEKGSDPNLTIKALKKASNLLKEYAGAEVSSDLIDLYPVKIEPKEILLKFDNANRLMGTDLPKDEIVDILHALGMTTKIVDENKVYVYVPTNKADVTREVDVIEEILRIYGFNKVEIPTMLKTTIHNHEHPSARDIKITISELLANNGFNEMMGLSLAESNWYTEGHENFVFINNTSNVHLDIMRPDALYTGLESVSRNINYQNTDLALFEFGRTYLKKDDFIEKDFLSLFISGKEGVKSWMDASVREIGFFDLKKSVIRILERLNIENYQVSEIEENPQYGYGLKFHRGNISIVEFGKLAPKSLKPFDIKQEVFHAHFHLENVIQAVKKTKNSIKPISKFPSTSRDLALVIKHSVKFLDIERLTKKTEKKLITDIQLFDVYKNDEHLGEGNKSYAVKFVFQNLEKTLVDKEVDAVINKLIKVFGKELGAIIRK